MRFLIVDEVGEHAAEPALVDVGHGRPGSPPRRSAPGPASWCPTKRTCSPRATVSRTASRATSSRCDGLGEIDDVDPVALGEDERAHLGIPAAGLMAEVDSGLEQLPHRNGRHGVRPPVRLYPPRIVMSSSGTGRSPWTCRHRPDRDDPRVCSARRSAVRAVHVWRLGRSDRLGPRRSVAQGPVRPWVRGRGRGACPDSQSRILGPRGTESRLGHETQTHSHGSSVRGARSRG